MSYRDDPEFEIDMLKETYDKKIEELKQENKILKDKYMEIPKLTRSTNDDYTTIDRLEQQINELKLEKQIIQEKYDALVERIIESKLKKRFVKMTPEQEEIVEMFRMEL